MVTEAEKSGDKERYVVGDSRLYERNKPEEENTNQIKKIWSEY